MRKLRGKSLIALALGGVSTVAWACADSSCSPTWTLSGMTADCGNRGILSPGNDSRVNLLFLLRSKAGTSSAGLSYPKPDYETQGFGQAFLDWNVARAAYYPAETRDRYDFRGSRCISLTSGNDAFTRALSAARGLSAAERDQLVTARAMLAAPCNGDTDRAVPPVWPEGVTSKPGREFLGYVQAAHDFYSERWAPAREGFGRLAGAGDPWVRESALYMLARVDLNAAQAGAFDQYGWYDPTKVDGAAATRAQAALAAYLKTWPQGRYAASATGLQRRALWLRGDSVALAAAYARQLALTPADEPVAADLVQEIDAQLLFTGERDRPVTAEGPLLLAAVNLVRMRGQGLEPGFKPISLEELEAQAPVFAREPDLFGFLKATHAFHVRKNYQAVLQLIPDDARQPGYSELAFSRQVLRGMALAALGDRNETGFWRELLGGATGLWQRSTVELGLALSLERKGQVAAVFAKDSPIRETMIRRELIAHSAGPALLRQAAQDSGRPQIERDMALFALLYKQLSRGDYAGFAVSQALVPANAKRDGGLWDFVTQEAVPLAHFTKGQWSDGFPCPAIGVTARALAANPQDHRARLCLGDFWRLNGFDGFNALDYRPDPAELGGTANLFAGKPIPRSTFYASTIADPRAPAELKAYALYRSVMCYSPSASNSCGGDGVDVAQRKVWFDRLKRDYPQSPWAKKLRYYW
ncbi:MAG: hypothetical protein ACK439_02745 [Novosphingobium sp.]